MAGYFNPHEMSADGDLQMKFAVSRSESNISGGGGVAQQPSQYGNVTQGGDASLTSPQQLSREQWERMQQDMHRQQQEWAAANGLPMPAGGFGSPTGARNAGLTDSAMGAFSPSGMQGPMASAIYGDPSAMRSPNQTGFMQQGGSRGSGATPRRAQQQGPVDRQTAAAAAAATGRLLSLDPRMFTVDDINELLRIIEVSNQYGKEIERSVEELATLLQKKTIECEGLRKLAAENHSALADAVKNEYNSRVRVETKQANEIRDLQNKIASMRGEKDDLQKEVETLRMMVDQLKSTPTPLTDRENHEHTLFNRLANGIERRPTAEEQMMNTWNMPRPSQLTVAQRELVNFVGNISADVARGLQSAGSFDFLLVLCQRLCTPTNEKGDIYPEMGPTLGELLRELRVDMVNGQVGASQAVPEGKSLTSDSFLSTINGGNKPSIAQQAATGTIPLVKKSARMRVIDLFLANNPQDYTQPNKVTELNKLLEDNEGKEEELYSRLMEDYRRKDPRGTFLNRLPPNNYIYQPPQTPENATVAAPTDAFRPASTHGNDDIGSAAESELHVRVALMYKKYNPSKLQTKEYKELVAKYPPETLLRALIQRYGPEPSHAERRQLVRIISENAE